MLLYVYISYLIYALEISWSEPEKKSAYYYQVWQKSLMAEWLEQASQWHEMYCYDLEVMSSNPCEVELGVCLTSVLSRTWTKISSNDLYSIKHRDKQTVIV